MGTAAGASPDRRTPFRAERQRSHTLNALPEVDRFRSRSTPLGASDHRWAEAGVALTRSSAETRAWVRDLRAGFSLGHPGFAQAGEISDFEQGLDRWHPPVPGSLYAGDARITTVAEPLSFGEFHAGAFDPAFERIGGSEAATSPRQLRICAARPFEPEDCLIGA